jgi:hypothetical protein
MPPTKPLSHHRIDWAAAAVLLANGCSTQETAERLGIHRTTVWRALKSSPRFRAAVEGQRARRVADTAAKLEALRGEVAEALVAQLRDGDRRVLLWLADRLGLMGIPSVPGGAGAAALGLPALVSAAAAAAPGEAAREDRRVRVRDAADARIRARAQAEAAKARAADDARTQAQRDAETQARSDRALLLGPAFAAEAARIEAEGDRLRRTAAAMEGVSLALRASDSANLAIDIARRRMADARAQPAASVANGPDAVGKVA